MDYFNDAFTQGPETGCCVGCQLRDRNLLDFIKNILSFKDE